MATTKGAKKAARKKAAKKAASKTAASAAGTVQPTATAVQPIDRTDLLTELATITAAKPTHITVTFTNGLGMLTATLFQHLTGAIIGHDSVGQSGIIVFNNASSGDAISVNGNCTGSAKIEIDVKTDPTTPVNFTTGNINFGFDIL